jgi:streptogramin lyase
MWYTLTTAGTLYHFDYATEEFDGVYPLPTPLNGVVGAFVSKIDGNVWLAEMLGQAITKIDVFTDPLPASFPTENTVDAKGRYWYSTATRNTIQYLDGNNEPVLIDMPDNGITSPIGIPPGLNIAIHAGPDNAIYFSQVLRNRIGRYQL